MHTKAKWHVLCAVLVLVMLSTVLASTVEAGGRRGVRGYYVGPRYVGYYGPRVHYGPPYYIYVNPYGYCVVPRFGYYGVPGHGVLPGHYGYGLPAYSYHGVPGTFDRPAGWR